MPHLAFGNWDTIVGHYDKGNVDLIPLDGVDKQQLINDITGAPLDEELTQPQTQDQEEDDTTSVTNLIAEMDTTQQQIDEVIGKVQEMDDHHQEPPMRRLTRPTRG